MFSQNYVESIFEAIAQGMVIKYVFDFETPGTHTFTVTASDKSVVRYNFQTFAGQKEVRYGFLPSNEKNLVSFGSESRNEFRVYLQPAEGYNLATKTWAVRFRDQKIVLYGAGCPGVDTRPFVVYSLDVEHTFTPDRVDSDDAQ
jgi:hypothetical protein